MIKQQVKEIMAEVFEMEINNIHDDASQKNIIAWDSLVHLNLIVELEDKFDVCIEPEEIGEMTSLEIIIKIIEKLKK
jgi:acyl carrier protein